MIPPCDPTILENNPRFKKLYQDLTSEKLNADGSTRANDALPARKAVMEELKDCQLRNAKKHLKKKAIRQLAFDVDSGLPDEYRDTVAITSLYLDSSTALNELDDTPEGEDTLSLLTHDIEAFYSTIPSLITPLSNILSSAVHDLRTIANAGTTPPPAQPSASGLSRTETSRQRVRIRQVSTKTAPQALLSSQVNDRVRALRRIQLSELPAARRQMAATAAAVLATRAEVLERTVVLLERSKHGALARATKAKAEHLATVAEGVEGKLNVMELEIAAEIYTTETVKALHRYREHLKNTREQLEERERLAIRELKAYEEVEYDGAGSTSGNVNNRPMAEIARRYGSLVNEVKAVKQEIRRLGG